MTDNNLDLKLYWIINPYRCHVAINETAVINRNGIMVKALILLLLIGSSFTELNLLQLSTLENLNSVASVFTYNAILANKMRNYRKILAYRHILPLQIGNYHKNNNSSPEL
jgi:hypothetical protein